MCISVYMRAVIWFFFALLSFYIFRRRHRPNITQTKHTQKNTSSDVTIFIRHFGWIAFRTSAWNGVSLAFVWRPQWIHILFTRIRDTNTTSGNLVTSTSAQNGHKGTSSQGDGGIIGSPARRSEVSPIQYHVSTQYSSIWTKTYIYIYNAQ